jgi:hypothetical protein
MIDTIEARTSNDDLLDLVPDTDEPKITPSPKQRALIEKLTNELQGLDAALAEAAGEYTAHMDVHNLWTPGREGNISRWIDRLIAKVSELRKAQPAVGIEDGMYVLDGVIFKVQHAVHGSGNQYAKRLVPNDPGQRAEFVYAPGMVRKLRPEHRMTRKQAKEWGALYRTCCRCGRVLTAEDSIDRMMGPVCAGKL